MRQKATARIGQAIITTTGAGFFTPEDLPNARWVSFYARHFDTVEINNTFYHLPTAPVFDSWKAQAPAGFCYTVKFNRYASHFMRLKEPRATLKNLIAVTKRLQQTLGPILIQLPPRWSVNANGSTSFLRPRRAACVSRSVP